MVSTSLMKSWIAAYPEGIYTTDGRIIFCQPCLQKVNCTVISHVRQHSDSVKHKANLKLFQEKTKRRQSFLEASFGKKKDVDEFSLDICKSFIGSNIPLKKLNSPPLRAFLEKYCDKKVPDESTIRKNYLDIVYSEVVEKIKEDVKDSYVWASVDETCDFQGNYVANIVIGKLQSDKYNKPCLAAVKFLEATNSSTICRFVNDTLVTLQVHPEKLLLLLTDGAAYMLKAGKSLKDLYPNVIHTICVCHNLHRLAEEVRKKFDAVDNLINNTKKVFLKAPTRIALYKETHPSIPLPPEPVITRWTTWIEAVIFYANYFEQVKEVIFKLDAEDAVSIEKSQEAFNCVNIKQELAYIKSNYEILAVAIDKLQSQELPISTVFEVLENVEKQIFQAAGPAGDAVRKRFTYVFSKNTGLKEMQEVAKVLQGQPANIDLSPAIISSLKFAPLSSVDVERSFSTYKNIFTELRNRFTIENLEKTVVCNCYLR